MLDCIHVITHNTHDKSAGHTSVHNIKRAQPTKWSYNCKALWGNVMAAILYINRADQPYLFPSCALQGLKHGIYTHSCMSGLQSRGKMYISIKIINSSTKGSIFRITLNSGSPQSITSSTEATMSYNMKMIWENMC